MADEAVRVDYTYRSPLKDKPPPQYIPMRTFLSKVWEDIDNEREFVYRLWTAERIPFPQAINIEEAKD